MTIEAWLSYLIPSGTGGTILILGIRYLIKTRDGKLSRAELMNNRAVKAERLAARYLAFIWQLLGILTANNIPHPRWPKGLKPKE